MICEYCESQISNQCTVCPVCGNPVEKKETSKTSEVSNPKNKLLIVLGTVSPPAMRVDFYLLGQGERRPLFTRYALSATSAMGVSDKESE